MKQSLRRILLPLFFLLPMAAFSQTLVHYWNFNSSASIASLLTPNVSLVPGASIVTNANGTIAVIENPGTGQDFDLQNLNARNGDPAGTHLRYNNPIGGTIEVSLPTTGYQDPLVKYVTRRSGSGAGSQIVEYSTDGVLYKPVTTIVMTEVPTLITLNFTDSAGVDNNLNFKLRFSFAQGTGGTVGNNRFDNFTLDASPALTEQLIHYWNFNSTATIPDLLTATVSTIPGAGIVTNASGSAAIIEIPGTGQNFDLQNLNARNGDAAGTHLRYNNPIGGTVVFSLPTTGAQEILVKYATRRSSSGAGLQKVEYTTDGNTWLPDTNIVVTEVPTLIVLDFKDSAGVNNNPNFKLRISFEQGPGGTVGNNRFDNFTLDGKMAIVDNNPPSVSFNPANNAVNVAGNVQPTLTFSTDIRLIDDNPVTNANVASLLEFRLTNALGAVVPFTASFANKIITVTPDATLLPGTVYYLALKPDVVEGTNNVAIADTKSISFTTLATSFVSFSSSFLSVSEADGSALVTINLANPQTGSFRLTVKPAPWSNASLNGDFFFASTTINLTAASPASLSFVIPISDDDSSELDEYFVLGLEDLNGITLQGRRYLTIYIRDNDRKAPTPTGEVKLEYVGSYDPSETVSTTEIIAYDPTTKRLYMTSAVQDRFDIADFTNPNAIAPISSINMASYGGVTSVAVRNGLVAVASPNANEQLDGFVVFFNADGVFQKQVTVGALPDNISFSPDGSKVLTSNEGSPNDAYTIDPEGSVSIIDVSGGVASIDQSKVTTVLFTSFNANEAALIAAGIRKAKASSTLSQDLEPEFLTYSADGTKAFVTCQENNSIAELDIVNKTFTRIWSLGMKDFNTVAGGGFDASDNSGFVHISNYPVKGFYMPDAISTYSVGGKTYLVTANEGDEKELTGLNERTTVGAVTTILDPVKYPNAEVLKETFNLGRLRITNLNGDNDKDGDYDDLVMVGPRSFSIWDAETDALVWDSKDEIELFTSQHPVYAALFNADSEDNAKKGRSRSKGPEPEGLTVASINGQFYAFVALERVGGLLVYNITDPLNPVLVDYRNERTLNTLGGDRGPESVVYINPTQSPDGMSYALVANEISGTVTIYRLNSLALPVKLLHFDATLQNEEDAQLNWQVSGEEDMLHFEIEHSTNGRDFTNIGKVISNGKMYQFTHSDIAQGRNLYRLHIYERNGASFYSKLVVVNRGNTGSFITGLQQNPVQHTVTVGIHSATVQTANISILNTQGQRLATKQVQLTNGKNQVSHSVANQAAGAYLMLVETADGEKATLRFVKQ